MNRGEIWLAQVGRKRRPVLVLTRSEVLDVRELVTVAEITTAVRGLAVEVPVDPSVPGIRPESAINCDGIHTVRQSMLTRFVGTASRVTMDRVGTAVSYALDC